MLFIAILYNKKLYFVAELKKNLAIMFGENLWLICISLGVHNPLFCKILKCLYCLTLFILFLFFSPVLLQFRWCAESRTDNTAIHIGSRNFEELHPWLLHHRGWTTHSLQGDVLSGCFWWAFQSTLCVWHFIWCCFAQYVHVSSNNGLQHWCWCHPWKPSSQGS